MVKVDFSCVISINDPVHAFDRSGLSVALWELARAQSVTIEHVADGMCVLHFHVRSQPPNASPCNVAWALTCDEKPST